jgi:hypothetical protein
MKSRRELLKDITDLMGKEVAAMQESDLRLTVDDVLNLTRMSNALLSMAEDEDKEEEKQKEVLSKLSENELRALAEEALKKGNKK